MTLNSTLKCVNGVILFIRSRALNHRQFRELLELSNNSCEDVLYHTAVRWLSQGETSSTGKKNCYFRTYKPANC